MRVFGIGFFESFKRVITPEAACNSASYIWVTIWVTLLTVAILGFTSGCGLQGPSVYEASERAGTSPDSGRKSSPFAENLRGFEPREGFQPGPGGAGEWGASAAGSPKNVRGPSTAGRELEGPADQGEVQLSAAELILGGRYRVKVPDGWLRVPPAVGMIEYEFRIPAAEGDGREGRATFMAAGGSVEANINRWIGQFRQPDEVTSADRAKVEKFEVAGALVHWVDISGTYLEAQGPMMMAQTTPREGYRMLGAVIEAKDSRLYFIKFYGPEKTVSAHAGGFRRMLEEMIPVETPQ